MSTAETAEHPPIYDRLVRERGDVPAGTRKAAEQTRAQAQQALDWSGLRRAQNEREERAFSAFGREPAEDRDGEDLLIASGPLWRRPCRRSTGRAAAA